MTATPLNKIKRTLMQGLIKITEREGNYLGKREHKTHSIHYN